MNHSPILVTGATGKTGRRIVQRLHSAGYPVRAGSRAAQPAFDWTKPELWPAVLEGVRTVYVSYAPDLAAPDAPSIIEAFTARARHAGVERLVLLSGRGEKGAQVCEEIATSSGVPCTRLRASWFFQNFDEGQLLPAVLGGQVALPAGDVLEPFVDADDIADVAFAALTDARHDGQLYELTGPRLLTFEEAVREISNACGRSVSYASVSAEDFEVALASEMGREMARFFTELCKEVFDGRNAHLTDGVRRALGREPRDFAAYCHRCASSGVWSV
jgi:uncharacterized protein YbjT (DUF2867 family)